MQKQNFKQKKITKNAKKKFQKKICFSKIKLKNKDLKNKQKLKPKNFLQK